MPRPAKTNDPYFNRLDPYTTALAQELSRALMMIESVETSMREVLEAPELHSLPEHLASHALDLINAWHESEGHDNES